MALNQIIRFIPSVSFPVVLVYRISFMVLFIVMITGLFGLTKLKFVDMLFLLCGTYILLINLINGVGMVDSLVSICWPFAFIFGEKMADSQCYNRFKKIRLIIYFLIVAASTYAMYVNFTGVPTAKTNIIGVNYIIYYGLPLLLAPYSKHSTNKKSSRYSTVALFMLWIGLAIFSFKRTTLIAVVGGVLIYLYKKYFANKKMKNKFLFLLILLVLVAVAMVVNNYTNGYIIERLNDVQETGGNGRVEIWSLVINLYSKSSFVEKLFGNGGLDAVNAMIGVSAHNEFLEILYDYGIFGVFFVGIALTALLLELFSKKVRKSNYAPLVWTTLVILCVLAMFSHIFLYPFVSIPVFFFLGNLYSACKGISETADTLYKIYSDDVF